MHLNTFDFMDFQLGVGPKELSAVDTRLVAGKLHVNQSVVAWPTHRVDHAFYNPASNKFLQCNFTRIRDYFCQNLVFSFNQAKNNRLTSCCSTSRATNSHVGRVRIIDFNLSPHVRLLFTFIRKPPSQFDMNRIDRANTDSCQPGRIRCLKIELKVENNSAKCLLCNLRTTVVPIFTVISGVYHYLVNAYFPKTQVNSINISA